MLVLNPLQILQRLSIVSESLVDYTQLIERIRYLLVIWVEIDYLHKVLPGFFTLFLRQEELSQPIKSVGRKLAVGVINN